MRPKYVALLRNHSQGSGIVLSLDGKNGNYYYEKHYCKSILDAEILARQLNKLEELEEKPVVDTPKNSNTLYAIEHETGNGSMKWSIAELVENTNLYKLNEKSPKGDTVLIDMSDVYAEVELPTDR